MGGDSVPPAKDTGSGDVPEAPRQKHEKATLPAAPSAWFAWLLLALINGIFIQRLSSEVSPGSRALHHLYDAGQLLAVGGLWFGAARVYALLRRFMAARLLLPVSFLLLVVLSYVTLFSDLEGFVGRHAASVAPWRIVFALAGAVALAGCLLGGLVLRHFKLGAIGLLAGLGLGTANHLLLELSYPGAHLVLAAGAALLLAASVQGLSIPQSWLRPLPWVAGATAFLGLGSVIVPPRSVVRGELLRVSGAVVAPFAARAWVQFAAREAPARAEDSAWFKSRAGLPPIPAQRFAKAPAEPIVILLTVDGFRADLLRTKHRKHLKTFSELRRLGLDFSQVWAPSPATHTTVASLYFGTYYSQQKWTRRTEKGNKKPSRPYPYEHVAPRVPALLSEAGVRTVQLLTHGAHNTRRGIGVGFTEQKKLKNYARTTLIVDEILRELEGGANGPRFIHSHLLDPHNPYTLGGVEGSRFQRYVAEVAVVDREIGRLRAELRKRGLAERTYLIISADHGEAFGEHGRRFHETTLYEEMIRVPLLIEGPGIEARRIAEPVTLLDLSPTLLDLFGVDTPGHFMGQSLVPFFRGESPKLERPLAADCERGIWGMLLPGNLKAIVNLKLGTEEVYDLTADPRERKNLIEEPRAREAVRTLRAFFEAHRYREGGYVPPKW